MEQAFLTGFITSFSLILAIGAQNAFVLRQGLKGEHVLPLVLFCGASDAVLITAGVLGFGAVVALWPALPALMAYAGAAFLFVYGAMRFVAAWKGEHIITSGAQAKSVWAVLGVAAAFTWGNPHVYVDTLALIGAISTGYLGASKWAFAFGAILASFTFFFALGFGARLLAPLMTSVRAWRVLDVVMGVIMWWLAVLLFFGAQSGLANGHV